MHWIVPRMKWVMLVSGLLTCTMLYAAIAPDASLRSNFGDTVSGPLALMVVRNWGILIFLVGAMLIYGAFNPPARRMALAVAGASKLAFIGLVLSHGQLFMAHKAGVAVVIDSVMVVLFFWYLLAEHSAPLTAKAASAR